MPPRPAHFCQTREPADHIRRTDKVPGFYRTAAESRLLVFWQQAPSLLQRMVLKHCGTPYIVVGTNDLQAKEYGSYCGALWRLILSKAERDAVIAESRARLKTVVQKIRQQQPAAACVFGTGPSLEEAESFDFRNCVSTVCNSIVQNDRLLKHIQPTFITAGDVVSHLGVSKYAEVFRRDLVRAVLDYDMYFVTTAAFGYLALQHMPEIKDRTILIEQTQDAPNYDLLENFGAPRLDSTLNIHMLPLAATCARRIFILGCDGKSTTRSNEDFWAHAQDAQYAELVATGHQCHPTFDVHRQKSTYDRYLKSTTQTIETGEVAHGRTYFSLRPSNVPPIGARELPRQFCRLNDAGQIDLARVCQALDESAQGSANASKAA